MVHAKGAVLSAPPLAHTLTHTNTQKHSVAFYLSNVSFYHKHFKVPEVFQTYFLFSFF